MKVFSKIIELRTYGPMELHPLTNIVKSVVAESSIKNGIMWMSIEGATPALLILTKGVEKDVLNYVVNLVLFKNWRHDNAYAHLISTIISTNLSIPIMNGELVLDPNEEIYILETRSVYNHLRRILIEIHGN
ncbi:MAG: YjbQ family protein [Ignisphaera sp.]